MQLYQKFTWVQVSQYPRKVPMSHRYALLFGCSILLTGFMKSYRGLKGVKTPLLLLGKLRPKPLNPSGVQNLIWVHHNLLTSILLATQWLHFENFVKRSPRP